MQTATLPPSVANLVSGRTRAVLTGAAVMLPFPTTPKPAPTTIQVNTQSFYIFRYVPDNVRGWMQGGPVQGWRGNGKRWSMTPHRAHLLLTFCEHKIPESVLPKIRRIAAGKAAA